jgi:hypothetical protein
MHSSFRSLATKGFLRGRNEISNDSHWTQQTASKINQDEVRERYPLKEERSLCALSADSISPKPATLE